jgi:hypothetical protein
MTDDTKANIRLDHINGDIREIKAAGKETFDLLRKTREDMAGLRTEVRIVGGFVVLAISTFIIAAIGGLF